MNVRMETAAATRQQTSMPRYVYTVKEAMVFTHNGVEETLLPGVCRCTADADLVVKYPDRFKRIENDRHPAVRERRQKEALAREKRELEAEFAANERAIARLKRGEQPAPDGRTKIKPPSAGPRRTKIGRL